MDRTDIVSLVIGLAIAGGAIYAFERGIIKVPGIAQTNPNMTNTNIPSNSSTTNSTSTTTTNAQTTTTNTQNNTPGTVSGTAYSGNGTSSSTGSFVSTPPSSSSSSSGSSPSNTTPTSSSGSGSSVSNTNNTSSPSSNNSYPSSSGGTGNVQPPTTGNCAEQCNCPQGINGQCYCPNCNCFNTQNVTINNNYGSTVQIMVSSEYVTYCNSSQGITWINGKINAGEYTIPLPVAPSTNVGGAIYIYPPNNGNNNYPFLLNYQFANGNQVIVVQEVDLAPTTSITVTNNSNYDIVLSNVSNFFNNQKVIIAPGQSGTINIGNGWLFAIGTTDPFDNFPSTNPSPVKCFNQFVLVQGQPAINYINDGDYSACSQYSYTVNINGTTYNGDMGSGLNYNVQTVNTSGGSSSSSTSSSTNNPVYGHIYGGVRPKAVPY